MSAAKTKQNISLNQLPPGKNIPGTAIVVDAFKYRNPDFLYFLSHFHQDHYGGITKNWSDGPIYCSQITARLLRHVLDVPEQYIKSLPQNEPVDLNAECRVTLMDANHCPGAHVLIFDVKTDESVKRYVHCGDMRYEARMKCWPSWFRDGALVDVETVFLDTTYCNPRYKFPKQDVVTAAVGELVASRFAADLNGATSLRESTSEVEGHEDDTPPLAQAQRRTLFVVATYTIGKEKVLHEISTACGDLCIYTSPDKKEILNLLDLPYANIFVREPRESSVHMITWGKLGEMVPGGWRFLPNWGFAQEYLDWANSLLSDDVPKFTHLAGIVPTGWTWEFQKQHGTGSLFHCTMKPGQEHLCIYEVPYSEHSNFEELREFVEFLKPARVVPTVVGKSGNAGKLAGYFRDLVDSRKSFQLGFNDLFADKQRAIKTGSPGPPDVPFEVTDVKPLTSATDGVPSPSEAIIAVCPVCDVRVDAVAINGHLDICLSRDVLKEVGESAVTSPSDGFQPRTIGKRPADRSPTHSPATKRAAVKGDQPRTQTKLSTFFSKK